MIQLLSPTTPFLKRIYLIIIEMSCSLAYLILHLYLVWLDKEIAYKQEMRRKELGAWLLHFIY